MLLLLGRLDCGPQGLVGSEWQSRLDARLASLLDCITPAAQPLLTLLLRWHLDEQVPPSWANPPPSTCYDVSKRSESSFAMLQGAQEQVVSVLHIH